MAGSFFHLWLARQAYAKIYKRPAEQSERCWGAFAAGVLAPDLGFFPGGPAPFSDRVHHERSGDFTRQLYRCANGEVEEAFAAGWALHIYTDSIFHPWVNSQVAALLKKRACTAEHAPDLWHLRLEWGIDCFLLGQNDVSYLWAANLYFPQRNSAGGLLSLVGRQFYPEAGDEAALEMGMAAVIKWSTLLPLIFLWTGQTRRHGHSGMAEWVGRGIRPLSQGVARRWMDQRPNWKNEASVGWPWHPSAEDLQRAFELGNEALFDFYSGYADAFNSLPNLDLDSGELVP